MNKQKFLYFVMISLGFSTGLFLSFLICVLVFQGEVFGKPWDVIWTGLLGVFGSLMGSLVGGVSAYAIAKHQVSEQRVQENAKNNEQQKILSKLILTELIANRLVLENVINKVPDSVEDCASIAQSIISGRKEVLEAFTIILDDIEIDYIIALRSNLTSIEYLEIHRCIQSLIQISRIGDHITELTSEKLLQGVLIQLRSKCTKAIYEINSLTNSAPIN